MVVAWMLGGLGGCVAEESERERGDESTNEEAERLGLVDHGLGQTSLACDGTLLPSCDGPFTGAACDLPCALAPPGLPPLECGVDRHCHSDGSTYGLAARNAVLYPASPDDPDEAVQANLEAWIVEHPADLGLEAGLTADELELHRMSDFRSSAGVLADAQRPALRPHAAVRLRLGGKGRAAPRWSLLRVSCPMPMVCEDCGNGVREGSETCDGTEWLYASCDAMPEYAGGALGCDQNACMFDVSECTMPGLDTTAGTFDPEEESTTSPAETAGVQAGPDGCGCRARGPRSGRLALLSLLLLGARRRRRLA
ncbi:hypothetical protein [Paraliomyxa miuraensis]|uniref:hypothetical protein n=1 Tax=Paraliomyxa miuraensis TaxID=376150 RepID=UPI002250B0BE|nr:hypothetical protein [Paraliomyxa miuraensis]MCX4239341.1 hypothetical protein [Paraliomyxa miuraensis]